MLGFNPLSDSPISDISLPVITGTIYAVDSNDTATLTAQALVQGDINTTDSNDFAVISGEDRVDGYILATDNNDTATLTGQVLVSAIIDTTDGNDTADFEGAIELSGVIDTTDENDTADIEGNTTPTPTPDAMDMHDGFRPEEVKRLKKLQKKIAQIEAQKIQARLDKQLLRKQQIRDLIEPPLVTNKTTKVKSVSEVKIDKPSIDLKKLNATIINLERQKQQLLRTVELRNQVARAQALLAIHEAQLAAERDDEEALLLLI